MIELKKLEKNEWDDFIKRNQEAFREAVVEEYENIEEEIISKEEITSSLSAKNSEAFNIYYDGKKVGGVVVQINNKTHYNSLDLLFVDPKIHGKNIGYSTWKLIESMYPETKVWETHTPYFEKKKYTFLCE